MKKKIFLFSILILLVLLTGIGYIYDKNSNIQYGYVVNPTVNIPPVGYEANLLQSSIASINTVLESRDGDKLIMFKDGTLIHFPVNDETVLSQISSVYKEVGYWIMNPSNMTEFVINKVTVSVNKQIKVDVSITTHFLVENPKETGFVITDKSKIKLLDKEFHLEDSFTINDSNEKILDFINSHNE
ncbi:MAG: hypothetical protein AAGU76_11430 [Sedimentibacter sp.]|uniref:hypothetical protein n=1 Tax=Sedimentibacter sp. TaxID=1960295 RepID=UPI0031580281